MPTTNSPTFGHDPEHKRFRRTSPTGTTLQLGGTEKVLGTWSSVRQNNDLVTVGGLVCRSRHASRWPTGMARGSRSK